MKNTNSKPTNPIKRMIMGMTAATLISATLSISAMANPVVPKSTRTQPGQLHLIVRINPTTHACESIHYNGVAVGCQSPIDVLLNKAWAEGKDIEINGHRWIHPNNK
ncbi:MAG: hypothetical protein DRR08_07125 [Candidatus Parabeggiatoa sp. nov. 2]|jgi:hypothetical protein|nr:MAG: hypothetical protein B6247_16540 [Beggiatoa sp. 4572_84]RKZ62048.1 MAG: hypothetical protein DRR08_07125 [Gammaproteobacteria bacterium]